MRQTNLELVTDIMQFSEYGALSQLVVMEAIESYVNRIVSMGLEKMKEDWPEYHLINAESWYAICEEIKKKLEEREE